MDTSYREAMTQETMGGAGVQDAEGGRTEFRQGTVSPGRRKEGFLGYSAPEFYRVAAEEGVPFISTRWPYLRTVIHEGAADASSVIGSEPSSSTEPCHDAPLEAAGAFTEWSVTGTAAQSPSSQQS